MSNLTWAIQRGQKDSDLFVHACIANNVTYKLFDYKPFSKEIPTSLLSEKNLMFYGSVGLCEALEAYDLWSPGVISIDTNWIQHPKCLNGNQLFKLRDVPTWCNFNQLFIRPAKDTKLFSGQIMSRIQLSNWIKDLEEKGLEQILDTVVLVSTVKTVEHEWRCFIVNGKFITGSHYSSLGQLAVSSEVPETVISFVEQHKFNYPVYCIDVCSLYRNDELFIIELNGFNSCGVYASDVETLVKEISNYYG